MGELSNVHVEVKCPQFFDVPGNLEEREVLGQVLSSEIRLITPRGLILYEGSLLDLAVMYLRDMREIGLGKDTV